MTAFRVLLLFSTVLGQAAESPRDVAERLSLYYGHDFELPVYLPAMALIGQLRLGHVEAVERLVGPYVTGAEDSLENATAMIATAMVRGVRNGWLDAPKYQPRIDKAWIALTARISLTGELKGVCESTGKQKSLEDYLHRKAINGRDARGGGMALLLATELCCN